MDTYSTYYLYDYDYDEDGNRGQRYFTGTVQAASPEAAIAKWHNLHGENPETASLAPLA